MTTKFMQMLVLIVSFLLTACSVPVYSNISEAESNEIVSALATAGIESRKTTSGEKSWSVEVDRSAVAEAVEVLKAQGLPRDRFQSLGELFKRESIVSSPVEERMRYLHGISQELSNTLSHIDGVISARVHVVIPANDPLAAQTKPSSASVFIKHRTDINLEILSIGVRTLVVKAIEGLTEPNVSVSFFPSQAAPRPNEMRYVRQLGVLVAARSVTSFWVLAIVPLMLTLLLVLILLIRYRMQVYNDLARFKIWFFSFAQKIKPRRSSGT